MKKSTVAVVGICAVVVLMSVGLLTGHNGALLTSSFSVIGALVGFVFGKASDSPAARDGSKAAAAALLCLGLAGCGTTLSVEGCYFEEGIGKVCITATRAPDGFIDIKIHGDAANMLPPSVKRRILEYGKGLVEDAGTSE